MQAHRVWAFRSKQSERTALNQFAGTCWRNLEGSFAVKYADPVSDLLFNTPKKTRPSA